MKRVAGPTSRPTWRCMQSIRPDIPPNLTLHAVDPARSCPEFLLPVPVAARLIPNGALCARGPLGTSNGRCVCVCV